MEPDYKTWVGEKVTKKGNTRKNREPKPFKSGLKSNTVKALVVSPYTQKDAFSFFEDDSIVDCYICALSE